MDPKLIANLLKGGLFGPKGPIRIWHGSPHIFDKYDIRKLGTGEGTQAFGKGIYGAEHPEVSATYQEPRFRSYRIGDKIYSLNEDESSVGNLAAHALARVGGNESGKNKEDAIKWLLSPSETGSVPSYNQEAADLLRNAKDVGRYYGTMYDTIFHANPEHLINYDKPFGGQSYHVQQTLRSLYERYNPGKFQSNTTVPVPENLSTAKKYSEAGIPGIKYLDQFSRRGITDPTSNYVIFNDKLLDIIKKYGIAGLPAAGALSQQQNQAPQLDQGSQ